MSLLGTVKLDVVCDSLCEVKSERKFLMSWALGLFKAPQVIQKYSQN